MLSDKYYWVVPNKILAGSYPSEKIIRDLVEDYNRVTVIDLTDELGNPAQVRVSGPRYYRRSIIDYCVPQQSFMKRILNLVKNCVAEGDVVLIHCVGGRGRTGTVVGCLLVELGLVKSGEEALERITELRSNLIKAKQSSPESFEQFEMVKNWKRGE